MDGLLEKLADDLDEKFQFNTKSKNTALSYESLLDVRLSTTHRGNYVGGVPRPLSDFFKHYYETIKTDSDITFTELDINTSQYSKFFKLYERIVQKLFFDYCFVKGLNFFDFEIQKDIYFVDKFKTISFDYPESMNFFYITLFLSLGDTCHTVDCDLFNDTEDTIATGLPVIVPHSPNSFFTLSNSVPAMIIKVRGA
jgi:hypothetical protein